jgi:hypothetical protein
MTCEFDPAEAAAQRKQFPFLEDIKYSDAALKDLEQG